MRNEHFPHLFEEGRIADFKTKNRLVMLPMARQFQGINGEVTEKTISYYAERAKGGVGLIILGSTRVFPPGHKFFTPASLNLCDSRYIAGHSDLVQALHAYGTKVSIQFGHIGGQSIVPGVAASGVQQLFCDGGAYPKPRPVTRSEIYDIIECFANGAVMARTSGYDMVEIHAAHDYLLGGFLSPKLNCRTDEFGGTLENRTRILVEMIKEMKRSAGDDFPICVRLSADDYVEGGITLDESPKMAKILEEAGADVISVSAGCHETQHLSNDIMRLEEGFKRPLFEAFKKELSIPVIAAGGFRNPNKCEEIVADGAADFMGMARPFLADPEWPNKAMENRVEDIRRCLSCGECLYRMGGKFSFPHGCAVNAAFTREKEWSSIKPAAVKRKVMIVGAGPAGMEAARIASLRGHEVVLYEKGKKLGGQLLLAAVPPGKERITWFIDYLITQLEKQGVEVKLGVEVTQEIIDRENPETLVLATGAKPSKPQIIGSEEHQVVDAWDILSGNVTFENRKTVILGGSMIACETAEFLSEKRNEVSVIKMRPGPLMAEDMEPTNRRGLLDALQERKVQMLTDFEVEGITNDGVKVVDRKSGKKQDIKADAVVSALGSKSVRDLAETAEQTGRKFYIIGDCNKPNNIKQAVYDGSLCGRQI